MRLRNSPNSHFPFFKEFCIQSSCTVCWHQIHLKEEQSEQHSQQRKTGSILLLDAYRNNIIFEGLNKKWCNHSTTELKHINSTLSLLVSDGCCWKQVSLPSILTFPATLHYCQHCFSVLLWMANLKFCENI